MGNIEITTQVERIDIDFVHSYLSNESYWAKGIPKEVFVKSIHNSLCFSLFYNNKQIGFARVVTDYATFGYLADVFIDKTHRKKGLGKLLLEHIMQDHRLHVLRRWMLVTADGHSLYKKYGFTQLSQPDRVMEITKTSSYLTPK